MQNLPSLILFLQRSIEFTFLSYALELRLANFIRFFGHLDETCQKALDVHWDIRLQQE